MFKNFFVMGDVHGQFKMVKTFAKSRLATEFQPDNNPDQDLLILLGDTGLNYYLDERDDFLKESLADLPIQLFIIRGNHEKDPSKIESYQEIDFLGGKALIEKKYPRLIFAQDGEIYTFMIRGEQKKALVVGGAYSVDKDYRLELGHPWFDDEQPSQAVKLKTEKNLAKEGWKVDYVFTHTAPIRFEPVEWFLPGIDNTKVDKSTEIWLDSLYEKLTIKKWYCGHYHGEKNEENIVFLYKRARRLDASNEALYERGDIVKLKNDEHGRITRVNKNGNFNVLHEACYDVMIVNEKGEFSEFKNCDESFISGFSNQFTEEEYLSLEAEWRDLMRLKREARLKAQSEDLL